VIVKQFFYKRAANYYGDAEQWLAKYTRPSLQGVRAELDMNKTGLGFRI
jgi:hypothetical protein